jgi:Fe-S oxidoreductase
MRRREAARAMLATSTSAREIARALGTAVAKPAPAAPMRVHGHCHQKAFGTFDATLELLRTLPGAEVAAIESSCCGMAGAFGTRKAITMCR